jgi:hypothetical protein
MIALFGYGAWKTQPAREAVDRELATARTAPDTVRILDQAVGESAPAHLSVDSLLSHKQMPREIKRYFVAGMAVMFGPAIIVLVVTIVWLVQRERVLQDRSA